MNQTVAAPVKSTGERSRNQLGMFVYLASDLMLFAPFFATYYLLRTGGFEWPPAGVDLDVSRAALATVTLIASSATLIVAERAQRSGDLVRMSRWMIATMVLGLVFLANQLLEYATLDFKWTDGAYGSIYWLLTGLHTLHITAGLLLLLAVTVRIFRVHAPGDLHTWTAASSAFWHLVDIVWIAVFVTIWIVR